MKINIKLFGITREIVGKMSLETDLQENISVGELLQTLKKSYPELEKLTSLMIAVNSEYVNEKAVLQVNDEVALIPPVSGG